jgi:hypothetical protein
MQRHVWGPTHLVGGRRVRHPGLLSRVADCRAEDVRDGQRLASKGAFSKLNPAPGGTKRNRLAAVNESLRCLLAYNLDR